MRTRTYGAMFHENTFADFTTVPSLVPDDETAEPNFSTGVKLGAGATTEIEIPVTKGSRFSLTFMAPPNVSAVLVDALGVIVGKLIPGTPEGEGTFRTITVKTPFEAGKWKLKLENLEKAESEIAIITFIDFSSVLFAEK